MQDDTADDLDPVRLQSDDSPCSLSHRRESFRKDIIEALSICIPLLKLSSLALKFFICELRIGILEAHDFIDDRLNLLQLTLRMCAEQFFHKTHMYTTPLSAL